MTRTMCMMAIALTLGVAATSPAQDTDGLRESFKARYPQLQAAKRDGKVGETAAGFIEAVKSSGDVASLVTAENGDRQKLYDILAKKEGITAAQVAQRNGERNFARAQPGEWLKGTDGKWTQKK